jgi:hypothetical protein
MHEYEEKLDKYSPKELTKLLEEPTAKEFFYVTYVDDSVERIDVIQHTATASKFSPSTWAICGGTDAAYWSDIVDYYEDYDNVRIQSFEDYDKQNFIMPLKNVSDALTSSFDTNKSIDMTDVNNAIKHILSEVRI